MKLTHFQRFTLALVITLMFVATTPKINSSLANQNQFEEQRFSGIADLGDIEQFADEFFARSMTEYHIPGAVFVVVQNGNTLLSKGYGYANLEQGIPVDPERTLFRVGSISKLFTATAVMKLWENNQVSLDDPISLYVDSSALKGLEGQITIRALLTHTSGLSQQYINIANQNPGDCLPLNDYIAEGLPDQITQAGQYYIYSNEGYAVLGYIVQKISRQPFSAYVEKKFFDPLGMSNSSFDLSGDRLGNLATGYGYKFGTYVSRKLDCMNASPAGALISTADDLAKFMIFQLNSMSGRERILNLNTVQEMQNQQFTNDPRIPGMTFGYREAFENGIRAIWHSGRTNGFRSLLYLIPSENLGIFIAYNTDADSSRLHRELINRFLDRYFPSQALGCTQTRSPATENRTIIGYYRNIGFPQTGLEKLISLRQIVVNQESNSGSLNIRYIGDATLSAATPDERKWCRVAPYYFLREDGNRRLVFQVTADRSRTYLFIQTDTGPEVFVSIPWIESYPYQIIFLLLVVAIYISNARFANRRFFTNAYGKYSVSLVLIICGLNLLFIVGMIVIAVVGDQFELTYGIPWILAIWLWIPFFGIIPSVIQIIEVFILWKKGIWKYADRSHYTLIALVNVAFYIWLLHWGLLGFSR
jgi:CubicO group peptidase (beta-lactamase class C family)